MQGHEATGELYILAYRVLWNAIVDGITKRGHTVYATITRYAVVAKDYFGGTTDR